MDSAQQTLEEVPQDARLVLMVGVGMPPLMQRHDLIPSKPGRRTRMKERRVLITKLTETEGIPLLPIRVEFLAFGREVLANMPAKTSFSRCQGAEFLKQIKQGDNVPAIRNHITGP